MEFYLVVVPLEELQEAGLGASGPLDPTETQVVTGSLQVAHVHGQVLQPQTCSLTHCGQLGRPAEEEQRGNLDISVKKGAARQTDKDM